MIWRTLQSWPWLVAFPALWTISSMSTALMLTGAYHPQSTTAFLVRSGVAVIIALFDTIGAFGTLLAILVLAEEHTSLQVRFKIRTGEDA